MTIRIFPSRLPGEPLETHQHDVLTLHEWFQRNVKNYTLDRQHPISVEINGVPVPPEEWPLCYLQSDSDVRMYPVPYGTGIEIVAWIAVGVAVAATAYSVYMMSTMDAAGANSQANGDQIDMNSAKANSARLGDPIREIFGRYRVYPDYLCQPVSRFVGETKFVTTMHVCIGWGDYALPSSGFKVGNTPFSAFGDDISYTIFPPGADISQDERTEIWYNSTEVGNSNSGTAGLDLGASGPDTVSVSADAILVSGNTVTLIGSSSDDDDETDIPESWIAGTIITIVAPDTFTVANQGSYSAIYGDLTELAPVVGMPVTLDYNGTDYDLFVASVQAGTPAVPGKGGNAASIKASAAPAGYDFSAEPVTFSITWQNTICSVSLVTNYSTMSGLLDAITVQLTATGLVAVDDSGRLLITEPGSPWAGGSIEHTALPVSVFGDAPVVTTGTASTGGSAAIMPHITLAYDSATGQAFAGLPVGVQRLSLSYADGEYRITDIDGYAITVERVQLIETPVPYTDETTTTVVVDATWPGFSERTLLDADVTGVNDEYDWVGPFMACPDGETTSRIEINLNFQNGLIHYDKKGKKKNFSVTVIVHYRKVGDESWLEKKLKYERKTENQIGFTEVFDVADGQYEMRMRRQDPVDGSQTRDQVYWQALRARLKARPTKYDGVTTMAVSIRTGNRLASQSDRRVSVVATRLYDGYPSRSISGALVYVLKDLGFTDAGIDIDTIKELETTYWTPRGETFDFATSDTSSALEALQKIVNAGMGYFLFSDGLASSGREGIKEWNGIITPQEMTEQLKTTFKSPSEDDYDGVDVTYVDELTWAEETVQCRLPGNPVPRKIESFKADGVTNRDRAYRIGMRRLLGYQYERLSYSTATELDALAYEFGDRIVLTDDAAGSKTLSCLIDGLSYDDKTITLHLTEAPDWTFENPRVMLRLQDGKASPLLVPTYVDDFTLSIANNDELHPDEWIINDPCIETMRLMFCELDMPHDGLIKNIEPGDDGTYTVEATQYTPKKYEYDDAVYPGNVT